MTPEEKQEFVSLRNSVVELQQWKSERERTALRNPLDPPSIEAISEGLRTTVIPRLNVDRFYLKTGDEREPSQEGEIVYSPNGGAPVIRAYFNGTVHDWGSGSGGDQFKYVGYRALAPTTDCAVADTVGGTLEVPIAGYLVQAFAYVDVAGTTGTMSVDVNVNGSTVLGPVITIESGETSSRTATTPPVIGASVVSGDILTFDIDAIQTTPAKGLSFLLLIFTG